MNRTLLMSAILACATASGQAQPPAFDRVMITEVSWGDPEGLEITNFSSSTVDLSSWFVRWDDGLIPGVKFSSALGTSIGPGEVVVVLEAGAAAPPEAPAGTQILESLPVLNTADGAFAVTLVDAGGAPVDEVRVSNLAGGQGPVGPGVFRGLARRGIVSGVLGAVSAERVWGLDSNSGGDWTDQPERSFGLENRSSGPRGTDPAPVTPVLINEIDPSPDYVELWNASGVAVDLRHWFLLVSAAQGQGVTRITPFPQPALLPAGAYVVMGNGGSPTELPAGTAYVNLAAVNGGALPFTTDEFACALYNQLGQLVDLVRAPGHDDAVVHNDPRPPSSWSDFVGAAGRDPNGGAGALGRKPGPDSNTGADWRPVFLRTMGSANSGFSGPEGHDDTLDVRLNETGGGDGLALILNAGASAAGARYSFFSSLGHLQGAGPFFGLGLDAINNWLDPRRPSLLGFP